MVLKDIKKRAPKDTGEYARSWKVLQKTDNKITVGTKEEKLFLMLEFGTSGHTISGDPLHFVINGEDVFVHFVDNKGFAAIPHLKPSAERFKKQFRMLVEKKVKKHWKIFK